MAPSSKQIFAAAIAVILACTSGWGYLRGIDFLAYIGAPGGMAMFLVNGAHGGNVFGALVFILANATIYYYLAKLTLYIWQKARTKDIPD